MVSAEPTIFGFYTLNYLYNIIFDLPRSCRGSIGPQLGPEPDGEVGDHDFEFYSLKNNNRHEINTLLKFFEEMSRRRRRTQSARRPAGFAAGKNIKKFGALSNCAIVFVIARPSLACRNRLRRMTISHCYLQLLKAEVGTATGSKSATRLWEKVGPGIEPRTAELRSCSSSSEPRQRPYSCSQKNVYLWRKCRCEMHPCDFWDLKSERSLHSAK